MESKKIAMVASGTALAIGGLFAYFFLRQKPQVKQEVNSKVPRDLIMKICKELRIQMFSTSLQIVEKRQSIQRQIETGAQIPNNMSFDDYVIEIGSKLFEVKRQIVCSKFEVDVNDLLQALEQDYSEDAEINKIQEYIYDTFENACKGQGPSLELDPKILDALPKSKVSKLHMEFFKIASKKYIQAFQEIKTEGEITLSFENPKFLKKIRDLHIPEAKREMLLREGLDQFQDSPREIFDKITQKYRQEDPIFSEGIKEYENNFSTLIDQLALNPFEFSQNTPDEIFSQDDQ